MLFKKLAFPQEVQTLPEVNASLFLLTWCGMLFNGFFPGSALLSSFWSQSEPSFPRRKQQHESTNLQHLAELPSSTVGVLIWVKASWGQLLHYVSHQAYAPYLYWVCLKHTVTRLSPHLFQIPSSLPSWNAIYLRFPESLELQIRFRCWKREALKRGLDLELISVGKEAMRSYGATRPHPAKTSLSPACS